MAEAKTLGTFGRLVELSKGSPKGRGRARQYSVTQAENRHSYADGRPVDSADQRLLHLNEGVDEGHQDVL